MNQNRTSTSCCLVAICSFCLAISVGSIANGQPLMGIGPSGMLYDVDVVDGVASNPRDTGLESIAGAAFASDGTLYAITTLGTAVENSLFVIDPTTGASTLVGDTNLVWIVEGDLTFDTSTGQLFGVGGIGLLSEGLFSVDVATGVATIIGDIGSGDFSGIAFGPSGDLFVVDATQDTLLRVDKTDATILDTISLSIPVGGTVGLTYHSATDSYLIADGNVSSTDTLHELDVTTGILTPIGSGLGVGLSALVTKPIPEPSCRVLMLASVVLLPGLRRIRAA